MLGAIGSKLVWDGQVDIATREQLVQFHDEVSLCSMLTAMGCPPWLFAVGLPLGLYVMGAGISFATGRFETFVTNSFVPVFTIDLFLVLVTVLWLDRRGMAVIHEIRDVFDVTDEVYYGFFGEMLGRIYEPVRTSLWPSNRRTHPATTLAYGVGIVAFLVVPYVWAPEALSNLVGVEWANSPALLQLYYVLLYVVVLGVGVLVGWVVSVGVVFMGWRITRLDVELDVSRRTAHLGLEPYSRLVFTGAFVYLLELVVSSLFVLQKANVALLVGYAIMTLIPVVGVFGGHYGLSRTIQRAKSQRLADYRHEFEDTLQYWFVGDAVLTGDPPDRLETFLTAKREVEAVPNWPFNTQLVVRLGVAIVASNVSILVKYFLVG